MKVKKRDGSYQELDINKIHAVLEWACNGGGSENLTKIKGVSLSEIEMKAHLQLHDKINTKQIHECLINSAADLISEETPNYDHVAARLRWFAVRKEAFGTNTPPHIYDVVKKNTKLGIYEKDVFSMYTEEEWDVINGFIDHNRDDLFKYAGAEQMSKKYLAQNRKTRQIYESFQFPYILVSAILFHSYPKETRLSYVKRYYDQVSQHYVSLPTPIMSGLRTSVKQFSSCFPAGQPVLTANGIKNIEDVVIGDCVLSKSGNFNKVLASQCKPNDKDFISLDHNLMFSGKFTSTVDHRVFAMRNGVNNAPCWIEAGSLKNNDYIHIPFNKSVNSIDEIKISDYVDLDSLGYKVDHDGLIKKLVATPDRYNGREFALNVTQIPNKLKITNSFCRLIGYYLAEGHANDRYVAFTMGTHEKESWIKDIKELCVDILGYDCSYSDAKDNSTKITISSAVFSAFIIKFIGTGFDKKKLPLELMESSIENQLDILVGVFRGDGCVHSLGAKLGMANKELINQLALISIRCKLYPSLSVSIPHGRNKGERKITQKNDIYVLNLPYGPNIEFVRSIGKNLHKLKEVKGIKPYVNSVFISGDFFTRVRNISVIGEPDVVVYDLQVENDPSFTIHNACVHNCTVIDVGDSLESIKLASNAIIDYASRKAGIGLNIGRIRAQGQAVRNGDAVTTGILPFSKLFAAALKSCSQGSVRGASATFNYPVWHLEFETLIELKNNKGTEETRLRVVDYCIHLNKTMYERLVSNGVITFFSPDEVPDLYEAFYGPADEFKVLYEKYEQDKTKTKKQLPAKEVFAKIVTERYDTGRIYIMHADLMNTNTPFKEKIYMTNLCVEIGIPQVPLTNDSGEISLCTLSAQNFGKIETEEQMKEACEMAVRGLDSLLTYQEYPNEYARRNVENYRPLGIGIIGFAHWLAKNNLVWGPSSEEEVLAKVDSMMYHLISTSVQLSKEFGSCLKKTKYHDGIMPGTTERWVALSEEAKKYGIRNACLAAGMPSETSSVLSNETNGFEPPKSLVTIKGSKDGVMPQVVPNIGKFGYRYQKVWDVPVSDYLFTVGVIQRYFDQSMSANTSYNPHSTDVSASVLIKDLITAYKNGVKTLYYNNTLDDAPTDDEDGCGSGGCKI